MRAGPPGSDRGASRIDSSGSPEPNGSSTAGRARASATISAFVGRSVQTAMLGVRVCVQEELGKRGSEMVCNADGRLRLSASRFVEGINHEVGDDRHGS